MRARGGDQSKTPNEEPDQNVTNKKKKEQQQKSDDSPPAKSPLMDRKNQQRDEEQERPEPTTRDAEEPEEPMCSDDQRQQPSPMEEAGMEEDEAADDYPHAQQQQYSSSMPCSPVRSLPVDQLAVSAKNPANTTAAGNLGTATITNRFALNIRETFDWITGRSRRKAADVNKENRNAIAAAASSANAGAPAGGAGKKTGVVSSSHSSSTKTRKATSSDNNCVADSFDDSMLDKLTELPPSIDRNEWLATHTLALFEHVNALCSTVMDHCTPASCSWMSYPGCTKAYWVDERGKRHQYSAARYIDCVMSFCEAARKNEAIFPTKYGVPFPADFEQHCRRIIRQLWHCCGHLYAKHWDLMGVLNLRPQCGLVLAHLAAIAKLFVLLDSKELNSLTNTLYLVRPPSLQGPPAKRSGGVGEQLGGFTTSGGESTASHNASAYWSSSSSGASRLPSKSGSWGGHSANLPVLLPSPVATLPATSTTGTTTQPTMSKPTALIHTANNNSPYAQTC